MEDIMIKKFARIFCIHLIILILVLFNPFNFWNRAHGDVHYMTALGIMQFEEKLQAPNFIIQDLNGKAVSLEDYRGKIVFLNFWATWCPPCLLEMPSMEKLHTQFKNKDFAILAIDLQEDPDKVRSFKERFQLNFPILLDADASVAAAYGIISIPTTYLVDRNGYLVGGALGPRDWASDDAVALIKQLIDIAPKS
jgi:peroxiredoxin